MKRRLLALLLIAALSLSLCLPAFAEDTEREVYDKENDLTFVIENGEATLTYIGTHAPEPLFLPEEVEGCPLTAIGENAAKDVGMYSGSKLENIVVPGTVKVIRKHGLDNDDFTSIYLCEGVEVLEDYALCADDYHGIVTLPRSIREIGSHVFGRFDNWPYHETVYAYSDSAAWTAAKAEGCTMVRRNAADGATYGIYGGFFCKVTEEGCTVTDRNNFSLHIIPDTVEGVPVIAICEDVFDHALAEFFYIPPTVTWIDPPKYSEEKLTFVGYPGSYAEAYCRYYGYEFYSVFTLAGVPFTDVPKDRWFYDAVCFTYNTGLMYGVSDTLFAPQNATTRAMVVTVLWRQNGSPTPKTECPFTDVPDDSWYTEAVSWATEEGIVSGTGNGKFSPNDAVTREQIALIFQKYAGWLGRDTSQSRPISGFPDAGKVSAWAKNAMCWARATGLISGRLEGNEVWLQPQAQASRAEIASILMSFFLS